MIQDTAVSEADERRARRERADVARTKRQSCRHCLMVCCTPMCYAPEAPAGRARCIVTARNLECLSYSPK